MGQVKPPGCNEVNRPNMGNWIHTYHTVLRGHTVYHHTIKPVLKDVVYTGSPVEIHIENFRCKGVLVFGLYNAVAALGEIGAGILCDSLNSRINFSIIQINLPSSRWRLILKNQEEASG